MKNTESRYISLLTDFGFKRIFGTSSNKDLLINFLNSLFEGEQVITDMKHLNSGSVDDVHPMRMAVSDVSCENDKGETFIVEMQNLYQKYFKDCSLFLSTYPMIEYAQWGFDWYMNPMRICAVSFLNFDVQEWASAPNSITHTACLMDEKTNRMFNDKLLFKYIEIAKFNKTEGELVTLYDKWLYVLKNMSQLDSQPETLKEAVFTKLFAEAEIAALTPDELKEYEDSLKVYRDMKNAFDSNL